MTDKPLSREAEAAYQESVRIQKEEAAKRKAEKEAQNAAKEAGKEQGNKDSTGEKPGFLRRVLFRLNIGAEKYLNDMEAYVGKQWKKNKAELEKEIGDTVKDVEKHTDDTIVSLEYKIHNLVKAGELDPGAGEKLTAQLEALRAKAETTTKETIAVTEEEFDEFDSGATHSPDADDSDREEETPSAATVSEAVPATPPEAPQVETPTIKTTENTPSIADQATDLANRQAKILETFKDNPHGRTEEEQNKFAWFELSTSADFPADTKQKVDALRQDWAVKDKAAGNPAELNDAGNDYKQGTDQWKLQTGEALRQIVEETKKTPAPEAQPAAAGQPVAEAASGVGPEAPATAEGSDIDENDADATDRDFDAARQENDREEDEGKNAAADGTEAAPKAETVTVEDKIPPETETKNLPERLMKKEGENVGQYLQKIDGSIRAGELTKSNMEDFRTHITKSFQKIPELKWVIQSVCEKLVKSKQTELAKQFAYAETNPAKQSDEFFAIASAMIEDGQATTPDNLSDALFRIIDPAKRSEILNKLDTKNPANIGSTGQAANDNVPQNNDASKQEAA